MEVDHGCTVDPEAEVLQIDDGLASTYHQVSLPNECNAAALKYIYTIRLPHRGDRLTSSLTNAPPRYTFDAMYRHTPSYRGSSTATCKTWLVRELAER